MSAPPASPPARPPVSAGQFTIMAGIAAAVLASLRYTEFNPVLLAQPGPLKAMADFGWGFFPPTPDTFLNFEQWQLPTPLMPAKILKLTWPQRQLPPRLSTSIFSCW